MDDHDKKLNSLFKAVTATAEKAYMQKETPDILNMAAASLQMAQAYQIMKSLELEELVIRSEIRPRPLPGEGPISGGGAN
jgi:hypothetical protein